MRRDEDIRDDILAEIDWDPRIHGSEIAVAVKDGAVTLHGTVRTYAEKSAAEDAAKRVKGVRAIAEKIEVKLPSDARISDSEIAQRIASMFKWNTLIPEDKVKAEVRNGLVTLSGEVEWNYQREAAKSAVEKVGGVVLVTNLVSVKQASVAPANVKHAIVKALHRYADIEASKIKIDVDGGRVTLSGGVEAFHERQLIENAVWAAPGVTNVVDNLRVS